MIHRVITDKEVSLNYFVFLYNNRKEVAELRPHCGFKAWNFIDKLWFVYNWSFVLDFIHLIYKIHLIALQWFYLFQFNMMIRTWWLICNHIGPEVRVWWFVSIIYAFLLIYAVWVIVLRLFLLVFTLHVLWLQLYFLLSVCIRLFLHVHIFRKLSVTWKLLFLLRVLFDHIFSLIIRLISFIFFRIRGWKFPKIVEIIIIFRRTQTSPNVHFLKGGHIMRIIIILRRVIWLFYYLWRGSAFVWLNLKYWI